MAETSYKEAPCENKLCDKLMNSACEDSEVKDVVNKIVNSVSEETGRSNVGRNNHNERVSSKDISNFVDMNETEIIKQNSDSSEDEKSQSYTKQQRSTRKRIKSVENESNEKEIVRRKFGSEGSILSAAHNIMSPDKQKELNEAIEQYIEKLIKDSIYNAVKSVNAENLCENILKNISLRHNSLVDSENDFVVEQRLTSNSLNELVELKNDSDSIEEEAECRNFSVPEHSSHINELDCTDNELDDDSDQVTYEGYLADLEDTASLDLKSAEESLNSSLSSNVGQQSILRSVNQERAEKSSRNVSHMESPKHTECRQNSHPSEENESGIEKGNSSYDSQEILKAIANTNDIKPNEAENENGLKRVLEKEQIISSSCNSESNKNIPSPTENTENNDVKLTSCESTSNDVDLIVMTPGEEQLLPKSDSKADVTSMPSPDIIDTLPQQNAPAEEERKINWKVGYLHVKLPHKTRGKTHMKAWKKRRVIIQPDEFVNDPNNPSLVISVYGSDSKKHETWHSVPSQKAVVFRSNSRTHRYAFTISVGGDPVIHLSADKESTTQEWMAAIRAVLWPPSPFMELEKMLSGREFEVSIVDNEYSYHAGLLGMYGYLSITPKKLILLHPQQGYVIQEWYLNTVDKFHFVPQPKVEDMHKVICMTTCKDSSTGAGEIIFFCNEAVTFLQSLASSIHQVLSYHSKQEGGRYQKELEEIAEWLLAPPQDCLNIDEKSEEHYKVPPRQVKSLLDIPNFIFNKSLSPVASAIYPAPNTEVFEPLDSSKNKPVTTSHDSGISACTSGDDFLNSSTASFTLGGGPLTGKSSDSELSDAYTPPRTPEVQKKTACEVVQEEQLTGEA